MKQLKFIFIISAICCSSNIYSQYLESSDIDKYIVCQCEINTYMKTLNIGDISNEIWNYAMESTTLSHVFPVTIFSDTLSDDGMEKMKVDLQRYMDIEVPTKVEEIFIKNGWKKNGHIKSSTMFFLILSFAIIDKSAQNNNIQESVKTEMLNRLSQLFHKDDVAFIDSKYKNIINRMSELKDATSKTEKKSNIPENLN